MTATAVLDRTTTTRVGASSFSPAPTSFGDDEYARQLHQRLAENRSAKPRQDSAKGTATHRREIEPVSTMTAEPRGGGLQNVPLIASPLGANGETAETDAAETIASWATEPSDADSSLADDSSQPRVIPSAPPVPWQQEAVPSAVPQEPASQQSEDLALTDQVSASPDESEGESAADAAIPQGLVRANEVTTAHSRGIIAPPGLVVAINAAQPGSTKPAQSPGNDASTSDATQGNAPPADGTAIDIAIAEDGVTSPDDANGEVKEELPSAEKTQQSDAAAQGAGSASSVANALDSSVVASSDNAALPENNKAGVTKDRAASQPAGRDAAADATQAVVTKTAPVDATTDVVASEIPAANATVSQKPSPAETPRNTPSSLGDSEHRKAVDGRDGATAVVADATVRAVEAIESAPAAPSANERAVAATQAIPAALHASFVERASDATDAPNASVSDLTANTTFDTVVSTARSDAKPLASPPTGQTMHTQHQSASNLADGLPRHAAAALRAAAGFDRPIRIRLSPAELGALQVEVGRHEGSLHARFEVTTSAAQSMLHDHLPALRESLGRAGLAIDRIDVRLVESTQDDSRSDSQSHSHSGGEQSHDNGQQQERGQSDDHQRSSREADDALPPRHVSTPKPVEIPVRRTIGSAADLIDIQI